MALEISLIAISIYLLSGLLFAIAFIIRGIKKVDDAAHGSSIWFRIIIIPGVVVFWPWLLKKWLSPPKNVQHD
jgi:uncharacterized membrane protein YphA (DoxX/SURF4 family)